MKSASWHRAVKAAVVGGLAGLSLVVAAADPGAKKPERRLPPLGSQTSDIPAGVDTGSPATSNSMQLGTPVPPSAAADRGDQNKRSAAARAAARPASSASAVGPVVTGPVVTVPAAAVSKKPAPAPKPVPK